MIFGQKKLSDEYADVIKEIMEGERRKPTHNRPKSVRDSGFETFVTPAHEVMFADFEWLAPILNRSLGDSWSIEETEDTLIRDILSDGPDVGRTYAVYYNSLNMGRIQVTVGFGDEKNLSLDQTVEWFRKHGTALVLVDLHYMRWIPYEEAHSLVAAIERLIGPFSDQKVDYARASNAATAALTAYLWEAVRVEDVVMSFDHRVDGPYDLVRQYTEHWKKEGINPFERWDRDTPS